MKKFMSYLLTVSMLISLCSAFSITHADTEAPAGSAVSTVEDFINMDAAGVYYLANDIDFSGTTYNARVYTKQFRGVLDGNGHSLTGITVSATNSDAGIFATSFGGFLKNVTFGSEDEPVSVSSTGAGYSVAAIAGTVVDGARFENVVIHANVKGDGKTAGFTSYMPNGKITIDNCKVYGSVSGNPASGYVCMADNGSGDITITNSENYASVSAQNLGAGGFYCTHSNVTSSRVCNLVIKGCANYGAISASDWRAGGIVGEFNETPVSSLDLSYCYNIGPVTMTGGGGFAAGIVGGLSFDAPSSQRSIQYVYNAGLIRNTANNTRAYDIAFANTISGTVNIKNAAYIPGLASKPFENCNAESVTPAPDKEALLDIVGQYTADGNYYFMEDTGNQNDGYPILFTQNTSHENVRTYSCGRRICLDCGVILSTAAEEDHDFEEERIAPDGYTDGRIFKKCRACDHTVNQRDEDSLSSYAVTPVDGVYTLSTPEELMWYSANVNAELLAGNEKIELGADINMTGISMLPIGNDTKGFRGNFDGKGHTVSGLDINLPESAGLFGTLGMGAVVKNLAVADSTIISDGAAGALFGKAANNAVIEISGIAITNCTVSSVSAEAGGLAGNLKGAIDVSLTAVVCDGVKVSGKTASGGVAGEGSGAKLSYVFANCEVSAENGATGTLATFGATMSVSVCGFAKTMSAKTKTGSAYAEDAFKSGEIAYLVNTANAIRLFGVENGRTAFSDTYVRLVRLGATKIYTCNGLSAGDGCKVYTTESGGKTTVVIVYEKKSSWLVDNEIKINGNTVSFGELELVKYVKAGDSYYVSETGCPMYAVTVDSFSSISIGSIFTSSPETIG